MADTGDVRTLGFGGKGLSVDNDVVKFTLTKERLEYLGTTLERLINGIDVLVEKYDSAKHGKFLGIGKKD